jgi:hypothetical protein
VHNIQCYRLRESQSILSLAFPSDLEVATAIGCSNARVGLMRFAAIRSTSPTVSAAQNMVLNADRFGMVWHRLVAVVRSPECLRLNVVANRPR